MHASQGGVLLELVRGGLSGLAGGRLLRERGLPRERSAGRLGRGGGTCGGGGVEGDQGVVTRGGGGVGGAGGGETGGAALAETGDGGALLACEQAAGREAAAHGWDGGW